MSLTLLVEPSEWQAAFASLPYQFQFTLTVDPAERSFSAGGYNYGGYLALPFEAATPPDISVGDRYYVGRQMETELYRKKVATITRIEVSGLDWFAITSIPFVSADWLGFGETVQLYSVGYIESLQPVFTLFVDEVPVPFRSYSVDPGGYIKIDASAILQSRFTATPPVMGVDESLFKSYRIDYKEGTDGDTVTGATKYALYAVVQPPVVSSAPDWEIDTTTARCKEVGGNNTGEREARRRDANECSPTFEELETPEAYFVFETDEELCPLPEYFTHASYERRDSFPAACGSSTTPTDYYSDTSVLDIGTRLYTDTGLTDEIITGFYKRQGVDEVFGYTPVTGIDSFFSC